MSAQVVGDAVERIRFGEEVDPTVLIGVHAGDCFWSLKWLNDKGRSYFLGRDLIRDLPKS
jgi:hypothetical protein